MITDKYRLLELLSESCSFDTVEEMLEEYILDSVVPGICPECGYTTDVEPDCEHGWCEECEKGTVVSAMVLADIM